MKQHQVITENYRWEYDVIQEHRSSSTHTMGIISREHYQARILAIAKGEWRVRGDEPTIWRCEE